MVHLECLSFCLSVFYASICYVSLCLVTPLTLTPSNNPHSPCITVYTHTQALWVARESEGETVYVPKATSASLHQFLGSLNTQASRALLSLDSALSVPPAALTSNGDNGDKTGWLGGMLGTSGADVAEVASPAEQALLVSYVMSRVHAAAGELVMYYMSRYRGPFSR